MSWDEFKGHDGTYFDQGLRVTTLELENGRYTAVWRPGSGTQWIRVGMSYGDFVGQDRTYFAQGLRITCLAYERGATQRSGGRARALSGGARGGASSTSSPRTPPTSSAA